MSVVTGTRAKAVVGASSLSTQFSGIMGMGRLPIVSCQSQRHRLQSTPRLKSSIIQQTHSSILSWLLSKRDGLRNLEKTKTQELFPFLCVSLAFCLSLIPNSLDFSHFRLCLTWKCLHLDKTKLVYSLKPHAFEHYSQPQQINITTFPYRLFATAKTL